MDNEVIIKVSPNGDNGASYTLQAGNGVGEDSDGGNNTIKAGAKTGTGNAGLSKLSSDDGTYAVSVGEDIGFAIEAGGLFAAKLDASLLSSEDRLYTFPNGTGILSIKVDAPATADSAGELGMWAEENGFLYVCTAKDTWKRIAIASW